jgi:cephalosporin-C deacetylase-like acetyl esterase
MAASAPAAQVGSALAEAQLRSMPFTRLVDGGMDSADARQLAAGVSAGGNWDVVAEDLAETRLERATRAESGGREVTRERELRAAAAAFNFAQMGFSQDNSRKAALYERFSDTIAELARASDGYIRRIEAPFRDGTVGGWLCLPAESPRPHPTVVQWGGLSGWGATYLKSADALTRRGVACVLAEGPGQGTPRLRDRIYLQADFVSGFAALVSAALEQPELGGPVGIQGNSFGGLVAAHVATSDPRVGACVINGAPAQPDLPAFRMPREQMLSAFGITEPAEVAELLSTIAFDSAAQRIECELLVLQGGADPLATPAAQAPFLAAGTPRRTTQLVWEDGEHTLYNHADDRDAAVADWFADVLGAAWRYGRRDSR